MKSSLFESQRALSVLAFLCEIRVWGLFWEPGGTSEQKLELNAIYLVAPLAHVRPEKQNPSHSVRSSSGDQCPVVAPHVHHGPRADYLNRTFLGILNSVSLSAIYRARANVRRAIRQAGIPARVINAELDDAPEHREQRARLGSVY